MVVGETRESPRPSLTATKKPHEALLHSNFKREGLSGGLLSPALAGALRQTKSLLRFVEPGEGSLDPHSPP